MTRFSIGGVERRMRDTFAAATIITNTWDNPGSDYAPVAQVRAANGSDRPTTRTRYAPPLAAAAAVLVVAGGATALLGPGRGHGTEPPAATGTTTSTSEVSTTARTAPPGEPTAGRAEHLPDLVQVSGPNPSYDMYTAAAPGGEREVVTISTPTSSNRGRLISNIDLVVFPASAGFDISTRMSGITRTPIAGHDGYYGEVRLFTDQAAKHGLGGSYALGYKAADGTWLFVVPSYSPTPLSIATLRYAYNSIGVRAQRDATRLPYRLGYLPPGLRAQSSSTSGTNPVTDVTFTAGRNTLDINISVGAPTCPSLTPATPQSSPKTPPTTPGAGQPTPTCGRRTIGDYGLVVTGSGYSSATLQRVADTLTLADLGRSGSTAGWWKLADALNPTR